MRSTYHQRLARGVLRGAMVLCAGVITLACGPGDKPRADTSAPGQQTRPQTPAATTTADPSGTLTKPMGYYETNPAEFVALVDTLKWIGHYYARECTGVLCVGNVKAQVLLEAIADANDVDVDKLPANGVLMARMLNVGKRDEKHYGIPADGGEWFILYYGKPGEKKFNFVMLTFSNSGVPKVIWDKREREFTSCGTGPDDPNHPKQKRASAGFTHCDPHTASRASSPVKQVWISCSLGCCSSDYPALDLADKDKPFYQMFDTTTSAAKPATSQ